MLLFSAATELFLETELLLETEMLVATSGLVMDEGAEMLLVARKSKTEVAELIELFSRDSGGVEDVRT